MEVGRIALFVGAGIGAFALLLLIISVGTTSWLSDGAGSSIGLFRKCYGDSTSSPGCENANRNPQAGLSIFGLLLLVFSIIATLAGAFMKNPIVLFVALGLLYFASIFVMSAYATWGVYSRDEESYFFPQTSPPKQNHTLVSYSYNLCVAAHYFLWTALTLLAFGVGYNVNHERNEAS